jgi:hypothetical protein
MPLNFAQNLLLAKLTVCFEEECKTIIGVYNDIKNRHKENPGLDYWFHEDFVVPLRTFVRWYNKEREREEREGGEREVGKNKVNNIEAREVLDHL